MLSQGQELAALDFAAIIGGPMQAVIKAQGASAQLTASFIQEVGFTGGAGATPGGGGGTATAGANTQTLKVVTFDFSSLLGSTAPVGGQDLHALSRISVPLLTMVPIPFLRVDSMTIQLNVRLVAQSSQTLSNNFAFSNSDTATGSASIFHLGAALQATVSEQNTLQNGQIIDDTYSLNVTVHCVQDQMPGGMAQVLNLFSNLIQTQGQAIQAVISAQTQNVLKSINAPTTTPGS